MILVVDAGHTVGAVLPADLEALVRVGRRRPVPSSGWTLTSPEPVGSPLLPLLATTWG